MATEKINALLKQKKKLFHTSDLRRIWGVQNDNTLYTTVKRYVKNGILFSIHKGLYSVVLPTDLDPVQLGIHALHRYAYVTTETILAQAGIIAQATYRITFVSEVSRSFELCGHAYLSRRLKEQYLHNSAGITHRSDGVLMASPERAVADMLYFRPAYHFDAASQINWESVKNIQRDVGYL